MTPSFGNGHMARALALAAAAAAEGEVPVGAVVVDSDGTIVGEGMNRMRAERDPTRHAEIVAIQAALRRLAVPRLDGCDLYVTLEPCPMCAGAIALARVRRLYYAASDPKSGGVEHGPRVFNHPTCHHVPEIYPGLGEAESRLLLRAFFDRLRRETGPK